MIGLLGANAIIEEGEDEENRNGYLKRIDVEDVVNDEKILIAENIDFSWLRYYFGS